MLYWPYFSKRLPSQYKPTPNYCYNNSLNLNIWMKSQMESTMNGNGIVDGMWWNEEVLPSSHLIIQTKKKWNEMELAELKGISSAGVWIMNGWVMSRRLLCRRETSLHQSTKLIDFVSFSLAVNSFLFASSPASLTPFFLFYD